MTTTKERRTKSHGDSAARLLVVDDEPQIRSALARGLGMLGYRVREAGSGREALALLKRAPCDAMVLDIFMPGMDGVEVMKLARQLYPDLAIIILTGRPGVESAIAAVKSEVTDYLLKPSSVHDIADAVTRALRKRQERTQGQQRLQELVQGLNQALTTMRQVAAPPQDLLPVTPASREPVLHVPPLTLDRRQRTVVMEAEGEPPRSIQLTVGETAVLGALMSYPDQVVPYRELVRLAWDYLMGEHEAQAMIRPYIFRLRRKLEANPKRPCLVRNVRGSGYLLACNSK
jgi:DNA-binding response OmpR family regulator